ncbi:MAG: HD domain-containing protein [Candidatus Bathyarchaeia archaeon]
MSSGDTGLMKEIELLIGRISDKELREKVKELLKSPEVRFEGERLSFEDCPGGSYVHHSYRGGLLQHTVAVARIALLLCDLVEEVYGGSVDRDTVLAGVLLHDLMKCYVYSVEGEKFESTPLGERIDHLTLLVAEMYRRDFPLEVIHVVVAHHGDNSPMHPRTLEALIVYMADFTDAELSRRVLRAAEGLVRRTGAEIRGRLSAEEALRIVKTKEKEGWEGLRRLLMEGKRKTI